MYWQVRTLENNAGAPDEGPSAGRFVLHRHHDADGPHLDLRLEQEGYLMGWRIGGTDLDAEPYATLKAPHPLEWLDRDGEAVREDAGTYAWLRQDAGEQEIELRGRDGIRRLRVSRVEGVRPETAQAIRATLTDAGYAEVQAAQLVTDGIAARRRALARFCGLGRELDGTAFDEAAWRETLAGASLDQLHAHLRAYEVRFDRKYPPQPVSTPEPLEDEQREDHDRTGAALDILRA
jgi:hypothetical protein